MRLRTKICSFTWFFLVVDTLKLVANSIIGGAIAAEGSFKYQVSIWEDEIPCCSGAILDGWRILTVAEPVNDFPPEFYTVHTGLVIQEDEYSPSYNVEEIHLHPQYDADNYDNETISYPANNLAILILRQPLALGEHALSVPLPTEEILPYCSFCKVAGWGLTDKILKWTFQTIYSPQDCAVLDSTHRHNEFCAEDPSGFSNVDEGDEGSPLVCDGIAVGIYIPSLDGRGFPVIYAKIFSSLSFINGIQKDMSSELEPPAEKKEKLTNE